MQVFVLPWVSYVYTWVLDKAQHPSRAPMLPKDDGILSVLPLTLLRARKPDRRVLRSGAAEWPNICAYLVTTPTVQAAESVGDL